MSLLFKTTKGKTPTGYLSPQEPASWARRKRTVDNLAFEFFHGKINPNGCLQRCEELLKDDPSFLPALYLILDCMVLAKRTGSQELLRFALHFDPFKDIVPEGFTGALDYENEETSQFLGCHDFFIGTLIHEERFSEALGACIKQDRWDRSAASYAKKFIGNLHLLLKNLTEAEHFFSTPPVPMPYESIYSVAYLEFSKSDLPKATETLRKAILVQPYVAEIVLANRQNPVLAWNFPDNIATFDNAASYTRIYLGGEIWWKDPKALAFFDWVYNSPEMLSERALSLSFLNRGPKNDVWEENVEKVSHFAELLKHATTPYPDLIKKILAPFTIGSNSILPWHYRAHENEFLKMSKGVHADSESINLFDPENPECEDLDSCEECEHFEECAGELPEDLEDTCKTAENCRECEIEGFCGSPEEEDPLSAEENPQNKFDREKHPKFH
jgi:hypothetical protein